LRSIAKGAENPKISPLIILTAGGITFFSVLAPSTPENVFALVEQLNRQKKLMPQKSIPPQVAMAFP